MSAKLQQSNPARYRGIAAPFDKVATGSYLKCMRAVGLKELKNRLSEYVRIASQGERVLVTNRDRVVAELVPPESGRSLDIADAALADLVREGILSPPLNRSAPLSRPTPTMSRSALLEDLAGDREER